MLRDNLVGLIEPMLSSAGIDPLALCMRGKSHRTIDPHAFASPAPQGAESTLTENAASPFHAEPRQDFYTINPTERTRETCVNSPRAASRALRMSCGLHAKQTSKEDTEMKGIVRCPYCILGVEFRPMVAHVDGG